MGDPNASIPTPEPVRYRPMFGAMGRAMDATSFAFVSKAALDGGRLPPSLGRKALAVSHCAGIGKKDMRLNDFLGRVDVDPDSFQVRVDGELIQSEPAGELPLAQRYFLF